MAKNDVVLIDAIIDQRLTEGHPSSQRDEVFEFLALEQLLKDYDLSHDEIESGWVDGRDDGGIDGFFVFVNGYLVQDPLAFSWPKRSAEIEVWIMTCKHHETFLQAPLNSLVASTPELLDLSVDRSALHGQYSQDLLDRRAVLHTVYRRLSIARPTLAFRFAYVSRGDSSGVASNIAARADQLIAEVQRLFSQCRVTFDFIGAAELVSLYRRTRTFSIDLPITEYLTRASGSYVALTRLDDYCQFVTDEHGHLRRYLFDSNVRDYLGDTRVNEDIRDSLADPDAPDFWWLNNGVTLLATSATAVGKVLQLQDIQIVNGLQTTESIFRHFESGSRVSSDRTLLVKVVVSSDPVVRDRIIRATNNQTLVEPASLHATDKIQRDIEHILERHDWYYERRKNYYRNIGKPGARFVTPMYLAAGYIALVIKNPAVAARLRSRFMRTQEGYSNVFSDRTPLQTWVTITEVLKRVEEGLSQVRSGEIGERFFAKWRNLLALLCVSKVLGRFSYGIEELTGLAVTGVTSELVNAMWGVTKAVQGARSNERAFRHLSFVQQCCATLEQQLGVRDAQVVGRRHIFVGHARPRPKLAVSDDFIAAVDRLLPPQPWKPGTHRTVAAQLGCETRLASAAIEELIRRGVRMRQENGVVYDGSGKIIAIDRERPETLGLTVSE